MALRLARILAATGIAAAASFAGAPAYAQVLDVPTVGPGSSADSSDAVPVPGTPATDTTTSDAAPVQPPLTPAPRLEIGPLAQPQLTIGPDEPPSAPVPPRPRVSVDPYAPTGLRLGGLVLHPSLYVGGVASSNFQQNPTDPQADAGIDLRPSLTWESDWSRHSWTGQASFDLRRWLAHPKITDNTGNAATTFRLDIRRDTFATLEAGYTLTQTGLGNSQIPASAIGTRADQSFTAAASLNHDFGPMTASLRTGATYYTFGDVQLAGGGVQNNADRAYVEPAVALRATYTDPPAFQPYIEVSYDPRLYVQARDSLGLRRSSQGGAVSLGVTIDDSPLWTGDVALTYEHRIYDDAALGSADNLGLVGSLTWSPTELDRVVLGFGTGLTDEVGTAIAADRTWNASLAASHDFRRNITGTAGVGLALEKIGGGYDKTYSGHLGLDWKFNPEWVWSAAYDFTWLNAAQTSRDYTEHRVGLGLTYIR